MKSLLILVLIFLTGCQTVACPPELGAGEECYYMELPVGGGPATAALGILGAINAMGAKPKEQKISIDP